MFQKQRKCPGRSQSQARDSNERFRSVTTSGMEKKIAFSENCIFKLLCLRFSFKSQNFYNFWDGEEDCLLLVVSENCISIRTSVVLNYLSRFSLKFQNFYNFLGGEEDYAVEGQIRLKLTGELSRWP